MSHSYREAIGPQNRVRNLKSQRKHNSIQARARSETRITKIRPTDDSLYHTYFIEHLLYVNKNLELPELKKLESLI
jgi:hypothetical protein